MITRDLLNKNIEYDGVGYDDICSLVNRWKSILVNKYGAKRGQILTNAVIKLNLNHIAINIAAGELGMRLLIMDKPVDETTIHMTKMALFGPSDITIDCEQIRWHPHDKMVNDYSKIVIGEEEIDLWEDATPVPFLTKPDDVYLIASTSGSTKVSRPVYFTHKEAYEISKRNISVFKFDADSRPLHFRNLHHASSLFTYMLPSLMICDVHKSAYIFNTWQEPQSISEEFLIPYNITHIMCANLWDVSSVFRSLSSNPTTNKLFINISGFAVTKPVAEYAKKYNIEFISHYGSIDTGIPLIVNYVDRDYDFEVGKLGVVVDDFYHLEPDNGITRVSCNLWDSPRILQDNLDLRDGMWYYGGRKDKDPIETYIESVTPEYTLVFDDGLRYLAIWDDTPLNKFDELGINMIKALDKKKFTVETKVNVDQLRAFFRSGL
jgi:hypothetical protein